MDSKIKAWDSETKLVQLLTLKAKYDDTHNSNKGFSEEGWRLIADEIQVNANACRKKFNDLLQKYRDLKKQKDTDKQKSWFLFEKFENLFSIPKQLLDHAYQEKPKGRAHFRWEDQKFVMKLIKLRRDYGPEYKSKQGFASEGWRKIADTLGSGITETACRKKYLKLVARFKKITNRKETETPEFFASMLKIVSNPKCVLKAVPKSEPVQDRNYYKWGEKVYQLINLRQELDAKYSNSYGFSMLGWDEIAARIDPGNVTAQVCRMKFLKLTTKHEKTISLKEQDKLLNFQQFCDSLLKMEERDNLRKNTTVQIESVEPSTIVSDRKYGKSMAVAKALYVNKKKYETARQYFKWETPENTFKLIDLVEKYSMMYPSGHGDHLSTIIWDKISEDFDDQVTPGSCRKKYSTLLKKYKTLRAEHNTIEKPWIFYDAIKSFNSEIQTNQTEEVFYENGSNGSFSEEVEKNEFSEAVEAIEEETTMDTEPTELSCVFCQGIPKSENVTLIDIAEDEKCVEMVDKINFVLFENFTEIFDENIYQMICTTCYENVESFYNFKKQSRSSLDKYKKGKKVTTAEIVKHEHNYENKGKRGDTDDKNEPPIKSTSRKRKMKKCCTICQRFFYNLKKHKLIAHTGRPKMKECHYCSKSFAPDQLKNHISMHLDERSFQCSICNRRFVDIKNLQHHVDEMHTADSKKYGCGICGAKFVLAISLKKHFLIHGTGSGLPEVIHKCETCNKVFVSKNGLKMHSLIHELPFACPLCPECFASENSLEIHCVLQHNEPTPFACVYCNMKFNYQSTMDLHYEEQHEKDIMDYLQEVSVVGIFS